MEHGKLKTYISGCRCEDCTVANRVAAREHRARKKLGTAARHVPPKKPVKEKRAKVYQGSPVPDGVSGWSTLGIVEVGGTRWVSSIKDEANSGGWRQVKVAADGHAENKANYWPQWNGVRFANGRDWTLLKVNRPEVAKAVIQMLDLPRTSP